MKDATKGINMRNLRRVLVVSALVMSLSVTATSALAESFETGLNKISLSPASATMKHKMTSPQVDVKTIALVANTHDVDIILIAQQNGLNQTLSSDGVGMTERAFTPSDQKNTANIVLS